MQIKSLSTWVISLDSAAANGKQCPVLSYTEKKGEKYPHKDML